MVTVFVAKLNLWVENESCGCQLCLSALLFSRRFHHFNQFWGVLLWYQIEICVISLILFVCRLRFKGLLRIVFSRVFKVPQSGSHNEHKGASLRFLHSSRVLNGKLRYDNVREHPLILYDRYMLCPIYYDMTNSQKKANVYIYYLQRSNLLSQRKSINSWN